MKKILPVLLALCGASAALPQEISITFNDPLEARGISIARETCKPAGELNRKNAWTSAFGSTPDDGNLRSFFLR